MTLKATLESALIGQATKAEVIAACDEELNLPTPPGVRRGERYTMTETCTTCGLWKGLHRWDTMQCPANGHEDGQFRQTTYTEENAELAALRAERDELREALEAITERAEAVADGIHVEKRNEGVSQAQHVRHMANHLAQHAKIARAVLAKYEAK